MRIGIDGRYVADHFPGIGRYTYNLASKLPELAPDMDFVLFHSPRLVNTRYDLERLARHANLRLLPVDVPVRSLREQYRLRSLAKARSLDLLHSPYYVMPYWLPCPSVVNMYDLTPMIYPQYLPHRWTSRVFRVAASLAVRRAARILAISECTKQDLMRLLGVPENKITVTHLAVDESFRPLDGKLVQHSLRTHGLSEGYFLYLGINKPHKNLVFLVQVFQELHTEIPLVLAGREDARYPEVPEEARRLGLSDRVVFLGDVAERDLPLLYNGAEAFLFPSLYEGFGLPVLEAMACGTPVVCSNTSSLPEIVGDAAITLHPEDTGAWVTALNSVLESVELRAELRTKGLEQAAKFTWQKTAQETLAVYRRLLSHSPPNGTLPGG